MNSPQKSSGDAGQYSSRPAVVLVMLLLVYVVNMVDRHMLGILAVSIQHDLALTNTQLGLLGGFAFVFLYTIAGIPIAWLSDRHSRTTIIVCCLSIWSVFTAMSGMAGNFLQLLLARIGVGIGEAGSLPASHSMIGDYFPVERRARALAILALGAPIGTALGIFFGGWIASHLGWQIAFLATGCAGLVLAPVFRFAVLEPLRGRHDPRPASDEMAPRSFAGSAHNVFSSRAFWLLAIGAGIAAIPSSGLVFWLPTYFQRGFGLDLTQASLFYGSIMLVGGIAGTVGGGLISDRLGPRWPAAYCLVPAGGFVLAVPTCLAALASDQLVSAWLLFVVWQALAIAWLGPVVAAIQRIFASNQRAFASASFLLVNNITGAGFGTFILGFISDRAAQSAGAASLKHAMHLSLAGYAVGAVLLAAASMSFLKEVRASGARFGQKAVLALDTN